MSIPRFDDEWGERKGGNDREGERNMGGEEGLTGTGQGEF